jgi:peptidoglycan/LPS O-acetylase OafA/YrhL
MAIAAETAAVFAVVNTGNRNFNSPSAVSQRTSTVNGCAIPFATAAPIAPCFGMSAKSSAMFSAPETTSKPSARAKSRTTGRHRESSMKSATQNLIATSGKAPEISAQSSGIQPPPKSSRRVPSLDGLRAISIILVILGHLYGTRHFLRLNLGIGDYAHLGVVVFFVISGFLITNLLLLEQEEHGRISLRLFYARRAIRIFPASYAFIACMAALTFLGVIHLHARDLWHAVTYTVNYLPNRSWQFGHLWSLSVEEQFYLLWPFAVVAFRPKRAPWIAAAGIALGPIARIAAWFFLRGTPYRDLEMFPTVADALATGCLLATAKNRLETQNWYLWLFRPEVSISIVALLLLTNRYMDYTVVSVFGSSVVNICLAILIHRCVYRAHDAFGRALNWGPVAFVGVLSYSLYIWQQPFLERYSSSWLNAFPQNVICVVLAAAASYFLLEKPVLKLRRRLRPHRLKAGTT